jgi:restriction system protein
MVITAIPPTDWRDLQQQVARIFQESGLEAEVEKEIVTVRGGTTVDVFARDLGQLQPITYLCECKHWQTPVRRGEVNAFLTTIAGYGANCGLIVSSGGFQSGAYEAAKNTNIRLLTWPEFQEMFVGLWVKAFMKQRLRAELEPLLEYMVPSYPFGFILTPDARREIKSLRQKYADLVSLGESLVYIKVFNESSSVNLARRPDTSETLLGKIPESAGLRQFLETYTQDVRTAVADFERAFGGEPESRETSPNPEAAPDVNRALRDRRR